MAERSTLNQQATSLPEIDKYRVDFLHERIYELEQFTGFCVGKVTGAIILMRFREHQPIPPS